MENTVARRLLAASIWGSAAVTLVVCALGVRLTWSQYRDTRGILLEAEKRAAAVHCPVVQEHLHRIERRVLDVLATGTSRPEDIERLPEEYPFVGVPFSISPRGTITAPHLRSAEISPSLTEEDPPPPAFEHATRLAHSSAQLEQKLRALEAAQASTGVAPKWPLRARATAAALWFRHGQPGLAAAAYAEIFALEERCLERLAWPSYLQLSLAYAEALAELARSTDVATVLGRGIAHMGAYTQRTTVGECEFFLRRADAIARRLGLDLAASIDGARNHLTSSRVARTAVENLRDLIQARAELQEEGIQVAEAQHFVARFSGRWIPTVWMRVPQGVGEYRCVGFQIDAPSLSRELERVLGEHLDGTRLRIHVREGTPADGFVALANLGGELDFITVGKSRDDWEAQVGRARRPFLLAGILIACLGAILLTGILILHRLVRREVALARMKTEFVASVSHELRTPLALIRLSSETLQLDRVREEKQRQKYYRVITRESERLSHLIGNVLNFASIQAGRKSYCLERRDIAPAVRDVLESYFFQYREKGFECSMDVPSSLPPVDADEEAVAQALINLLQNAERYSPETRRIQVRAAADRETVRISVRDWGVGISAEDQKKVWDDYYRTKTARALGTRGSGLGLSLVQHVMKAHGGRADLISTPGVGSTFTLVFPVARGEPSEVQRETENPRDRR